MFFAAKKGSLPPGWFLILACLAALLLQGCVALKTRHPLPEGLEDQAQVDDLSGIRAWGDTYSESLEQSGIESIQQEMAANHGKLAPEATTGASTRRDSSLYLPRNPPSRRRALARG